MIKNYAEMVKMIPDAGNKKTMVVVAAHDEHTLEAVHLAFINGIADPILIGDGHRIREIIDLRGFQLEGAEIIEEKDDRKAARLAVSMIRGGAADFLMKGRIQTADLLKEVVNKDCGLQNSGVMSHIGFFELPNYHKLLALTDGGMIPHPNLEEKAQIIINAVRTLHELGYNNPKVAVLAAAETVNPKIPESVEAGLLKKMNEEGVIGGCMVEGPISYDLAMSPDAAKIKEYRSPVSGDVDVLIMPDMVSGNILAKAFQFSAGAKMAGVIVGAKAPIVLVSRGATAEEKYLSTVLSAVLAQTERKGRRDGS